MPSHCLKTHSAILACHLSGNWGSTRCAEWSHAGPILLHIAQNTSQPIEDTTALLNWIDIARGRGKVLLTSFCNFAAEWRLFVMWSCPLCEVNAASIWFTIILAQYTSHNGEAYNDSSQCIMSLFCLIRMLQIIQRIPGRYTLCNVWFQQGYCFRP
jgi:hypothetical protein